VEWGIFFSRNRVKGVRFESGLDSRPGIGHNHQGAVRSVYFMSLVPATTLKARKEVRPPTATRGRRDGEGLKAQKGRRNVRKETWRLHDDRRFDVSGPIHIKGVT